LNNNKDLGSIPVELERNLPELSDPIEPYSGTRVASVFTIQIDDDDKIR
jgi:hypothetical protein